MQIVKVSQGGRVVIPAELREKLHINQGDDLIMEERNGELVLASKRQRLHRVQQEFQSLFGTADRSLTDELIAERRAEAEKEELEIQEFLDAVKKRST